MYFSSPYSYILRKIPKFYLIFCGNKKTPTACNFTKKKHSSMGHPKFFQLIFCGNKKTPTACNFTTKHSSMGHRKFCARKLGEISVFYRVLLYKLNAKACRGGPKERLCKKAILNIFAKFIVRHFL